MRSTSTSCLRLAAILSLMYSLIGWQFATAQKADNIMQKAPPRSEGEGPFPHLILRGVTLIDGTGAPPVGPVDIVIEKNRIAKIVNVGVPACCRTGWRASPSRNAFSARRRW